MTTSGDPSSHITARLQKASSDLSELDQALKSGDIDARVLSEFREAVNHIRQTAWAVQQWIELKSKQGDPFSVLSLLAAERLRITILLIKELNMNLDSSEVTMETEGMAELVTAVQGLAGRLIR